MPRSIRTAILVAASLGLASCGGNGEPQTTSGPVDESIADTGPTATPTSERWQYVAMGDSTHRDVATSFESILEEELGVEVDLIQWINPDLESYEIGGERAGDLVGRLRNDEDLRSDLREAEVITFVIPMGLLIDLCPFDRASYQPAGTNREAQACWPRVLRRYRADVDAFFDELVAIRSPSEAIIRVVDNYQYFWERLHELGVYGTTRRYWPEVNDAIHAAASEHGIPVVHAYDALNGPRGQVDGVAAGWVSSDQLHLSLQGAWRLAELLADLGFEPAAG